MTKSQNQCNIRRGIYIIDDANEFLRIMEDLQREYNAKHNGVQSNGKNK